MSRSLLDGREHQITHANVDIELRVRFFKKIQNWILKSERIRELRWPTSALRIPNYTPNSKPHSEF